MADDNENDLFGSEENPNEELNNIENPLSETNDLNQFESPQKDQEERELPPFSENQDVEKPLQEGENPSLKGEEQPIIEGEQPIIEGQEQKVEEIVPPPPPPPNPFEESSLEKEVKLLLELIFDEEHLKKELASEWVDITRFDFKLFSAESMSKAFSILSELLESILRKKPIKVLETSSQAFYQLIPHKFPQKKMLVLDSEAKIFAKLELLNLINDIQILLNLNEEQKQMKLKLEKERREREKKELEELEKQKKKITMKPGQSAKKEKEKEKEKEVIEEEGENKDEEKPEEVIVIDDISNFYDRNYENLHCEIETLSRSMKQFDLISTYLNETLQGINDFYTCEVLNVYKLRREFDNLPKKIEKEIIVVEEKHSKEKEKKRGKNIIEENEIKQEPEIQENPPIFEYSLLMYGCKLSNVAANISKGLRLPHSSAPIKAFKLGKGIYLSDTASKSTNFCYASKMNDIGFLILCQVELGFPLTKTSKACETSLINLPKDKKSVKGLGRITPKEEKIVDLQELDDEKEIVEEENNINDNFLNENQENLEKNEFEEQKYKEEDSKKEEKSEIKEIRLLKIPSGVLTPSDYKDSMFLHNEYVVFEEKHVKIKYLVKLKFNFK